MSFSQTGIPLENPVSIEKKNLWSMRDTMIWINEAEYIEDYKIQVTFSNGDGGIIDLKEVIHNDKRPVFRELIDTNRFRQFKVEHDTIVWKNGLDLAPEFLYSVLKQSQHAV